MSWLEMRVGPNALHYDVQRQLDDYAAGGPGPYRLYYAEHPQTMPPPRKRRYWRPWTVEALRMQAEGFPPGSWMREHLEREISQREETDMTDVCVRLPAGLGEVDLVVDAARTRDGVRITRVRVTDPTEDIADILSVEAMEEIEEEMERIATGVVA